MEVVWHHQDICRVEWIGQRGITPRKEVWVSSRYKKRAASARSPVTILGNAPRGLIDMAPEVGLRPALAAPAGENVDVVGDEAAAVAVLGSESLSMQSELDAGETPV